MMPCWLTGTSRSVTGSVILMARPGSNWPTEPLREDGHDDGVFLRCGIGEVDVGGGRRFGEAVAFLRADAEFFLEGVGEGLREFFRAGDDEFQRGKLGGIDALHVAAQEGGGGEEDVDLMEGDELGEALGFQRTGVGDEVDALDDRIPEGDGAAE